MYDPSRARPTPPRAWLPAHCSNGSREGIKRGMARRPLRGWLSGFDRLTAYNFGIDAGAAGLFAIFQGLTAPFVLVLAVQRGARPWEIGVLTAAPCAAMLLSGWYGRLAARRSPVPLVAWSTGLARLFILWTGWAHDQTTYILSYLGFTLLSAAANPAYTAIERAIYHERWRGRLMSGVKFVLGFCQFGATLLAGALMGRYHAGPVFTMAVAFGVASALLFTRMRPPLARVHPSTQADAAGPAPRHDPRFSRFLLALMLAGSGNLLVQPGYPIYQVNRLHLSDTHVAWLTAAWSLAWMCCYPLWGRICDRRRPAHALAAGFACYLVPPMLYALGASLPGLLVAAWVQGMGDAALDCGWQNHTMRLAEGRIGAYAGTYFTFLGIRGTLAPILGALILSRLGLDPLFVCGTVLVLAGLLVARRLPDSPLPATAGPLPAAVQSA